MVYGEKEARELVVKAGNMLVERGLVARTWGNISARVSDTHFVITPSGLAYDSLTPEKLVLVKISDCSYEGGIKPSSEKAIHACAYINNPDTGFVIHTHQDYASCIGISGKDISGIYDPVLGDCVFCAEYGMPSTSKLKKNVEAVISGHPEAKAIFMKHHGAVFAAADFESAFEAAGRLEEICRDRYEARVTVPYSQCTDSQSLLQQLVNISGDSHFSIESSPEVLAVAAMGKTLHPHLDDLAQIAGITVRCTKNDPNAIIKALRGRNAVLVSGLGAVCCARDKSDLEAIEAIMRKSCMTALYAAECGAGHLAMPDRIIMRLVYTMKYSKKKTGN